MNNVIHNYLRKKITKSDKMAILSVIIGTIGLSINYTVSVMTGNIIIWFACGVLLVTCLIEGIQKSIKRSKE